MVKRDFYYSSFQASLKFEEEDRFPEYFRQLLEYFFQQKNFFLQFEAQTLEFQFWYS